MGYVLDYVIKCKRMPRSYCVDFEAEICVADLSIFLPENRELQANPSSKHKYRETA